MKVGPDNNLKICHLTESFLPKVGGAQIVIDSLAREQAALGHNVTVACPRYPNMSGPETASGYKVERCFGLSRISFLLGVIPWLRLAAKERFDIIHAHNAWPGGTLGAITSKLFGAKLVITSHGRDIVIDRSIGYGSRRSPLINFITKLTLRAADKHTIVRGSLIESATEAGSALNNIAVVPNFVPRTAGSPSPSRADRYLLAMGRLHKVKRFELAIQAMDLIKKTLPDTKLVIAGAGGEDEKLKRLVADLDLTDSVEFAGQVNGDAKQDLIAGAWALLVTSKIEAFPVTPLEVMSLGVPVLAPNYEPFVEFIDGQNSLLVDPESPQKILEALKTLLDEKVYQRISRLAKETAAKFSPSKIVGLYQSVYEDVLSEKGLKEQPSCRKDVNV